MEPVETPLSQRVRYKLVIGKFEVKKVIDRGEGIEFMIDLPGLGKMAFISPKADVREGDYLTLYTEILAPERKNGAA